MAEQKLAHGRIERYVADQLAVVLPHLQIVQKKLDDLGIRFKVEARDDKLSMALLSFPPGELETAAATITKLNQIDNPEWWLEREASLQEERQGHVSPIDIVLMGLRRLFGREYDGWAPTFGKNREVRQVVGQPHVRGGGEGAPTPPGRGFKPFPDRVTRPDEQVRVAVLDTSLVTHHWLEGAYVGGDNAIQTPPKQVLWKLGTDAPKYSYLEGHCTFVSGLILQAAPSAIVQVYPVLDSSATSTTWALAKELIRLSDAGVQIACVPAGSTTDDGQPPLVLEQAINRLGAELTIVAAAGNHGQVGPPGELGHEHEHEQEPEPGHEHPTEPNAALWPAAFPDVVAVGAVDANLDDAPFTPKVPWITMTSLGVGVRSTYLSGRVKSPEKTQSFDGYALWEGSSFAAAIVAGTVAARVRAGFPTAPAVVEKMVRLAPQRDSAGRPYIKPPDPYDR
jgi:membrane-anchored mycosin MYCP